MLRGSRGSARSYLHLQLLAGPKTKAFLATAKATLDEEDYTDELRMVFKWFERDLKLIEPDAPFAGLGPYFSRNPGCLSFAADFLKSVSTGVDHLEVVENEMKEEDSAQHSSGVGRVKTAS